MKKSENRLGGLLLIVVASRALGCGAGTGSDSGGVDGRDASSRDASAADTAPYCDARGPCEIPINCDRSFWSEQSLPNHPWWLDTSLPACMGEVHQGTSEAPEALDDCGAPPPHFEIFQCGIPVRAAVCSNHYWTQRCQVSSDCPDGMACITPYDGPIHDVDPANQGICEQRCGGSADAACVRCGFVCAPEGYCRPAPPPAGEPCVADCQCPAGEWCRADTNTCVDVDFPPNGLCGEGAETLQGYCACNSGTCELEPSTGRGCCRGADGSIARSPTDKACQ